MIADFPKIASDSKGVNASRRDVLKDNNREDGIHYGILS